MNKIKLILGAIVWFGSCSLVIGLYVYLTYYEPVKYVIGQIK